MCESREGKLGGVSAFDVRAVTEHQVTNRELGLVEQIALIKNFLLWRRDRDGSWNETALRFPEYTSRHHSIWSVMDRVISRRLRTTRCVTW